MISLSNGSNDASTNFYSVDGMLSSAPSLEFRPSIMMIIGKVILTIEGAIGVSFIVYGLSAMLNHSWISSFCVPSSVCLRNALTAPSFLFNTRTKRHTSIPRM